MAAYYTLNADGTKQWRYRKKNVIAANGKKIKISGTPAINNERAAEAAERAHINRVQGIIPQAAPEPARSSLAGEPPISTLCELAIDEYRPEQKPRTRSSRELLIRGALIPFFGTLYASKLDQGHIEAFVEVCIKAGNGVRTINRKLTALSVVLGYAVARKKLAAMPALKLHRKEPKRKNQVQPYTRDEIAALLKSTGDQRYRVAILLGCDAGLRIGEIRGLQWTDVNLKRGTITVRRSIDSENNETGPKNGNDRELPISNALREELEALPRRSFWVLTRLDDDAEHLRGEARKRASGPGGFLGYFGMLGAMARIVKAAKLDDGERSPWHSLRHTFGSELHRSGASLKLIKEMMDHADIKTTEQYITTGKDAAREAIERAFNNRG